MINWVNCIGSSSFNFSILAMFEMISTYNGCWESHLFTYEITKNVIRNQLFD